MGIEVSINNIMRDLFQYASIPVYKQNPPVDELVPKEVLAEMMNQQVKEVNQKVIQTNHPFMNSPVSSAAVIADAIAKKIDNDYCTPFIHRESIHNLPLLRSSMALSGDSPFDNAQVHQIKSVKSLLQSMPMTHFMHYIGCSSGTLDYMLIAGGCIGSLLRGEYPRDIDVWFIYQDIAQRVKEDLLANKNLIADNDGVLENPHYNSTNIIPGKKASESAITLKNGLQFIFRVVGNVTNSFDFEHCKPYYDFRTKQLVITYEQYDLNLRKILKKNPQFAGEVPAYREQKYKKLGWSYENNTRLTKPLGFDIVNVNTKTDSNGRPLEFVEDVMTGKMVPV